MVNLVNEQNIVLGAEAKDWREAIIKTGQVMRDCGYVTEKYVQGMVETVEKYGPYIVIAEGLAMPHAKCTSGVLKSGIGIVTLKEPVEFGNKDNDPVHVLIGLAGANDNIHMDILKTISMVFEDGSALYELLECTDKKQVIDMIDRRMEEDNA